MTINSSEMSNPVVNEKILDNVIQEFRKLISGPGVSNHLLSYLDSTGSEAKDFGLIFKKDTTSELDFIMRTYYSKIVDATNGAYSLYDIINNPDVFGVEKSKIDPSSYFEVAFEAGSLEDFPALMPGFGGDGFGDQKSNAEEPESIRRLIQPLNIVSSINDDAEKASKADLLGIGFTDAEATAATSGSGVKGYFANKSAISNSSLEPVHINTPDKLVKKSKTGETESTEIIGTKDPTLGAFVFKNPKMNFSNRNNESLNIFFNAISPLEFSRCAPFLNIMVVTPQKVGAPNGLDNISFMRFIKAADIKAKTWELDENIGLQTAQPIFGNTTKDTNTLVDIAMGRVFKSNHYSYMDIFTAPQTMANANIGGHEASKLFNNTTYANNIIDPIQPFLTLEGVDINIAGLGFGFYASKIANITLTLHDRSRLNDIKDLIAPKEFGNTKMLIEYGWSHPDSGINSNNIMGQFLGQMRDTGYYAVKSSNFSFSDGNTVKINLSLSCYGGDEVRSLSCGSGAKIPINVFREGINQAIERAMLSAEKKVDKGDLKEVRHLMRVQQRNSNSISSMVTYQQFKKLNSILLKVADEAAAQKKTATPISSGTKDEFLKAIAEFFDITDEVSDPEMLKIAIEQQQKDNSKDSAALILGKTYALTTSRPASQSDGFLLAVQGEYAPLKVSTKPGENDKAKPIVFGPINEKTKSGTVVSLGRIVMSFIGHSLAVSGMFDEVQVMFYPLNTQAGAARGHTTASFPISKKSLEEEVSKAIFKNPNLSTTGFFNLINKEIISDSGNEVYGISSVIKDYDAAIKKQQTDLEELNKNSTDATKEMDDKKKQEIVNVINQSKSTLETGITQICKNIYTSDPGPATAPKFVKPRLKMYIETVPMKLLGTGITTDGRSRTVARVHIYDAESVSSPNESLIQSMIQEGPYSKIISSGKLPNEQLMKKVKDLDTELKRVILEAPASKLKPFVKRGYPSINYGASNGAVKSISISSNISNQVSQVLMITSHAKSNAGQASKNAAQALDETVIVPATLDLQILGMPMINIGAQIYVDFGTNTTLDNIYTVKSVSHSVKSGDFSTSVSMIYAGQGDITTLRDQVKQVLKIIE